MKSGSNKDKRDSKKRNSGSFVSPSTVTAKQVYEGSVASRAVKRAGKNKNLKGHVYEVMTCDQINLKPQNILQKKKAVLTKSPTAMRDDIVVKQGKKVVGRMQLKDTPKGIADTAKKVQSGQYKGTKLVGTKETQKAYQTKVAKMNANGSNITQKMNTNGISSQQTDVIAKKALGGNVIKSGGAIAKQASSAGMAAGVFAGALDAATSVPKVFKGEKTVKEAAVSASKEAATGATATFVGDMAATATTIAVAATPAAPIAISVGTVVGVAVSVGTDKMIRSIDTKTHTENRHSENVSIKGNSRVAYT